MMIVSSSAGTTGQGAILRALLPPNQTHQATALLPEVLSGLKSFGAGTDDYAAARYARSVLVPLCSEHGQQLYADAYRSKEMLGTTASTFLQEAVEEDAGCRRLRDRWTQQQGDVHGRGGR